MGCGPGLNKSRGRRKLLNASTHLSVAPLRLQRDQLPCVPDSVPSLPGKALTLWPNRAQPPFDTVLEDHPTTDNRTNTIFIM